MTHEKMGLTGQYAAPGSVGIPARSDKDHDMNEHQQQEDSDRDAARVQENRRRAGDGIPETPRQVAFIWMDLIYTIADQMGSNGKHMAIERLADLVGEMPELKSKLQQHNKEMSDAIERRSALRDHRR